MIFNKCMMPDNFTAFEDTEVRFLKSLPLLQLNNLKKRKERKEKIK